MNKEKYIEFLKTNLNTWFYKFEPCIFSNDILEMFENIKKIKSKTNIYPTVNEMFDAFKYCDYNNLKVVIIGDKPFNHKYSSGFAFGYKEEYGGPFCRTHDKFKNLLNQHNIDTIGSLGKCDFDYLAKDGVLMLNPQLLNTDIPLKKNIFKPFIDFLFFEVLKYNNGLIIITFNNDYEEYTKNPFHIHIKSKFDIFNNRDVKTLFVDDLFIVVNDLIVKSNGIEFKINW